MTQDDLQKLNPIKPAAGIDDHNARLVAPRVTLTLARSKAADTAMKDWLADCFADQSDQPAFANDAALRSFLGAVFELSPYLHGLARQYPQTVAACNVDGFDTALRQVFAGLVPDPKLVRSDVELMKHLRVMKKQAALICGLADLGGWWSSTKVSQSISDTADLAVKTVVDHLLLQAHTNGKLALPDPESPALGSGLIVLAMGKHGAGELNYSSDTDLIVLFDPDAPAIIDREECVTFYVRLIKAMVKILQDRTADGYVFRTDLRLRPDPGSMPLAIPLPLAMNYYESRGQNWERAALIKARPIAGECSLGEAVLDELRPFVWRRYLDFAAISDVHSIKRQIQSHRGLTDISVLGHNLKLGRGGIREIEFFVQTQQLIAGGRNPKLRGKRTVAMLKQLAEDGWISHRTSTQMAASYDFLRDIEHRLQMVADAQTHSLPDSKDGLLVIARLSGFETIKAFSDQLLIHLNNVERHYSALFESAESLGAGGNLSFTGDDEDPGTIETLARMGFADPVRVIEVVRGWHFGRYPALQSEKARENLTALTPALLASFQNTGRSDEALNAFDAFVQGLPAGFQLFALLRENQKLLTLLALVLGAAPRLATIITRRPHVFDGVLEPGFLDVKPDRVFWTNMLDRTLQQARDYEDGLDRARVFAAEQKFLIGIRFLSGAINVREMTALFSLLAETLLLAMVDWVGAAFSEAHGKVPGANFALVAMGNLGSGELTASSDLDLMLLYEFDASHDESDGCRPLHASQYFGRMTQRLIAAMSAPTGQGLMYELDFRLRPNGSDGPIATSLRAFEAHFRDDAWTWERLALVRARVLGKITGFSERVEESIATAIAQSPPPPQVAKEVLEMRRLMDTERPAANPFDVKLAKGGLIDLEFLDQAKVLMRDPAVSENSDTDLSVGADPQTVARLAEARTLYQNVIHITRLCLDQPGELEKAPPGLIALLLQNIGLPDFKTAEAALKELQKEVRSVFLERLKNRV